MGCVMQIRNALVASWVLLGASLAPAAAPAQQESQFFGADAGRPVSLNDFAGSRLKSLDVVTAWATGEEACSNCCWSCTDDRCHLTYNNFPEADPPFTSDPCIETQFGCVTGAFPCDSEPSVALVDIAGTYSEVGSTYASRHDLVGRALVTRCGAYIVQHVGAAGQELMGLPSVLSFGQRP